MTNSLPKWLFQTKSGLQVYCGDSTNSLFQSQGLHELAYNFLGPIDTQ